MALEVHPQISHKGIDMKLYLAGNFPVMKDPVKERDFRDTALGETDEWRRLLSYYYPKDVQTVIDMKREEINGGK